MRAFISYRPDERDRERRWVDPVACWASLFEMERDADAALVEARAILAETEPAPSLDGWAGHVPPHNDHTRAYTRALAEALAAWLRED